MAVAVSAGQQAGWGRGWLAGPRQRPLETESVVTAPRGQGDQRMAMFRPARADPPSRAAPAAPPAAYVPRPPSRRAAYGGVAAAWRALGPAPTESDA